MAQQTALIIHELMDNPIAWKEKGDGVYITNGYYLVALDGTRYGMASATYLADGAERDSLCKAVEVWKDETGWEPAPIAPVEQPGRRVSIAPDAYIKSAYEDFARTIRSTHKSFVVHKDVTVLSAQIQQAITQLDSIIRPMERIEGKAKWVSQSQSIATIWKNLSS